ncbi:MAG: T9SS type A sorting domain-containing protein, partial [candidate division Zixibacteria bacterium]|nr:T9SS type A sorting domain-containing protein [candidate division Zixibacteria bacterium]
YQKDGAAANDNLGWSVAGAGDVNGDAKADFIIGAYFASPGGLGNAGSAYLYSGVDGALLYQKDGAAASDFLGRSVAGAGDVNGDAKADFIIGAYGADPGGLGGAGSAYVYSLVPTDAPEEKKNRPSRFELSQNYPNPFNPTTTIRYFLPKRSPVTLEIFNLAGQRVKVLAEEEQTAGDHVLVWDGTDKKGNTLPSGLYLYRLTGKDFTETKKMIFLK